jgi:hypothetical protein
MNDTVFPVASAAVEADASLAAAADGSVQVLHDVSG